KFQLEKELIFFLYKKSSLSSQSLNIKFNVKESSIFENIDINEAINNLNKDGLHLGINLPEKIVTQIIHFANTNICYGNRKANLGFYLHQKKQVEKKLNKKFVIGGYYNTTLNCSAIAQLQEDPILLAIAQKYLKFPPVHQGNQLWWSFANQSSIKDGTLTPDLLDYSPRLGLRDRKRAFQLFHYDIDDYKFVKFFFYLTNVDKYSGPHICVVGSHNKKKISHLLFSKHKQEIDKEIIDYYGENALITICGKAGFGFIENPFCFHKGTTPIVRDRLILQIEFATQDFQMQNDIRDDSLLKRVKI
ncbi:MAG: hypothetical protein AAF378_02880, partial [Cyanobacteria bacterium P01_A01_bin.84]